MKHLHIYTKEDLLSVVRIRRFETKLGERMQVAKHPNDVLASIQSSSAKYVVVGVPEEIGVKANSGQGGAHTAWVPFLDSFLNLQSNDFLGGEEVLLLGHFNFDEVARLIEENAHDYEERLDAFRHAVNTIDDAVEQVVQIITQCKKIPIVIGGGHNNAYPCIKGAAKGWHKAGSIPLAQINVVNLDAHADYRPMEGRHSGNAFRYAEEDGYLSKYCVIGLHENYIPQNSWIDLVNNPFMDCITYEDIFVHEKRTWLQAIAHANGFTQDTVCGIEIDLDAIQNTLSSAMSPSGVSVAQARQFVHFSAADHNVAYLHISEGIVQRADGLHDGSTGKLISYLVADFIKAMTIE